MDNEKNVKKDGPGMLYLCATPVSYTHLDVYKRQDVYYTSI